MLWNPDKASGTYIKECICHVYTTHTQGILREFFCCACHNFAFMVKVLFQNNRLNCEVYLLDVSAIFTFLYVNMTYIMGRMGVSLSVYLTYFCTLKTLMQGRKKSFKMGQKRITVIRQCYFLSCF